MQLEEYRKKVANLEVNENKLRDLYLRDLSLSKIQGPLTGYPSLDKPWLKYYSEDHIKAEIPNMTAYEYLKKLNENNLDLIAIDSVEGKYTYRELFDTINNTAGSLYKMGIRNGNKIMMMLPPMPHESILFYATDVAGGVITELPIQSTIDDVINKLKKFDIDLFFVSNFLFNREAEKAIYSQTDLKNIIVIGEYDQNQSDKRTISWDRFFEYGNDMKMPPVTKDPNDLLFIASTGGSTGEPKSVMLSDNCFNIAVHQYLNSDLNYNVGDRWLRLWSLFSASAAVTNNHLPLCAGMNSVIRPFPIEINDFDKIVYNEKTDHLMLIPQLLDVLEKSELLKNEDLSNIKTIGCGGLAITDQFEERVKDFFESHGINTFLGYGWGCTESFTLGSIRSNFETAVVGSVGAPHVNTIVSAFDHDTMEEKLCGEEGEICIKSLVNMSGYYGDREMTTNVLKSHGDGSVWLHTGDLGCVDEQGIVTVKGRMTRTIFVFPTAKIYPTQLENIISQIPGVNDTVVGEIPDCEHDGFGLPVCFVIPEEETSLELLEKTVKEVCDSCLADYARPQNIYFLKEFPLTRVGKKDVMALERSIIESKVLSKKS